MIDPCECCSVPVSDIWFDKRCFDCWANEANWKRSSPNPCIHCDVPVDLRCSPEFCFECPVFASPDDIFANDLKQMSWEDYLAEKAYEREELL